MCLHNILEYISEFTNLIPPLDSSNNVLSIHFHIPIAKDLGSFAKTAQGLHVSEQPGTFFFELSSTSGETPSRPQQMRTTTNREEHWSAPSL